jgi:hypothetical protein
MRAPVFDAAVETTGPPVDITMTDTHSARPGHLSKRRWPISEPGHPPVDGDLEPWLPISAKACGAEQKDGLTSGSFNSAMPGSSAIDSPIHAESGLG